MKKKCILNRIIYTVAMVFILIVGSQAQTAWFADGYHGGIYGHYPIWQAKFMVDNLKKNPGWAINLEIEPETWDTISVKDADNFKAFQEYFESEGKLGRIEFVNPAWSQPYCYNISGESIIRHFSYGMAKTREYFPSATFVTYSVEEPCFTSSLPQILKGFDYKYAVLRNPNTCWGGYTSAFNKDLVNWIGPDGSSLISVPRYECEELWDESTWQTESWTNSNEFIEKCFRHCIQFPVGMCFQDAGWDGGPWNNEYKPTIYTTWTRYIEETKDKVEATDWEFNIEDVKPGLVWGAQVLQKIAQEVRVSENRMIMAEKMSSFDFLLNGTPWPEADIAEAWRTLMLAQHHDCWIVPYNGRPGNTWADKVTRWTQSTNQIAAGKIGRLVSDQTSTPTLYVRVFNTMGTSRTDLARLNLPSDFIEGESIEVFTSTGVKVPSQIFRNAGGNHQLVFEASLMGFGYQTYYLSKERGTINNDLSKQTLAGSKLVVETDFYRAIFDPSRGGAITSLIDKKNDGRELVEPGKYLNNLKGFFYQEGAFRQGAENVAAVSITEDGEILTQIKVENHIAGNNYQQLVTFYKNNPRIDFSLDIDWNGQPGIGAYDHSKDYEAKDRAKAFYNDGYKLHLEFPLKDIGERLFKNAPFDVFESQLDNTLYSTWDSIKHNVIVNWVDVTNDSGDYGVALFSDHTTSYLQTEELPLGLTVQYIGKALWGRNYSIHGPTSIKYALLPHTGNRENGQVQKASNEWNEPLVAGFVGGDDGPAGKLLLDISDENIELSAMTIDNHDLVVRFFNSSSGPKSFRVRWNLSAEAIIQVDLNGNKLSDVNQKRESLGQNYTELELPQFGFQTLKLSGIKLN